MSGVLKINTSRKRDLITLTALAVPSESFPSKGVNVFEIASANKTREYSRFSFVKMKEDNYEVVQNRDSMKSQQKKSKEFCYEDFFKTSLAV